MDNTGKIFLTVPDDKLADVVRVLDAGNSPECAAMLHGCDLVHVPDAPTPEPLRIDCPWGDCR